ncbi:hypothetical protein D3C83_236110 [compost metagenome]
MALSPSGTVTLLMVSDGNESSNFATFSRRPVTVMPLSDGVEVPRPSMALRISAALADP